MGNCVVKEAIRLPEYVVMMMKEVNRKDEVKICPGVVVGSTLISAKGRS